MALGRARAGESVVPWAGEETSAPVLFAGEAEAEAEVEVDADAPVDAPVAAPAAWEGSMAAVGVPHRPAATSHRVCVSQRAAMSGGRLASQ
jgi:hypothetical protein